MKYFSLLLFILCLSANSFAGNVDTITIYSNSMHKNIKAVVITPDSYKSSSKKFPVVYLLHGYDGWYSNWIIRMPGLKDQADSNQLIIVCPDGAKSSWYFDSPLDSTYKYETYLTKEVVGFIDKNYKTIADKKHRAITGFSMGGHGALFLALRHSNIFGAAGSMSGGVDLQEVGYRFDVPKRIGDTISHTREWHDLTVLNLVEKYTHTKLKIIFDCGNRDIFIGGNRRLHQKMLQLKIPHEYIEKPGQHDWDYWRGNLPYQLSYFRNFFNKKG